MKTIKLKSIFALILFSILTFGLASLATAQNDFSGDGNAVALWSVDNGALTTDSIGTNTLTDNNTVGTDTVDYQVGNASADFEISNSESLTILDSALNSGFPLKSGESNGDISLTFWYKKESNNSYAGLFSKWDTGAGARSFYLRDHSTKLDFYIGANSGAGYELLSSSLTTSAGRWYHVGATFNNTTKTWKLRVWDDTAGSVVLDASGTATNNIAITNAAVAIGASLTSGTPERYFDGLIDEVVVFRDILTTGEIDQIRSGTYSGPAPTTTTTLAPTTTTTTLAPTTTTTTLAPTTTTTILAPTTTTTTLPGGTTTTITLPGGTTTTTLFPPAGTNISNNGFEDSFPKTADGYVVWQGKAGNDWEIFLYDAYVGSGPFQITDNDYGDVKPETDGRYVTWASGVAPNGEIFLLDLATGATKRLTEIWDTDPTIMNRNVNDHDPKIVDGVVVWVSHSEGVDTMYGPGDIWLYNAAYGSYENISASDRPQQRT